MTLDLEELLKDSVDFYAAIKAGEYLKAVALLGEILTDLAGFHNERASGRELTGEALDKFSTIETNLSQAMEELNVQLSSGRSAGLAGEGLKKIGDGKIMKWIAANLPQIISLIVAFMPK